MGLASKLTSSPYAAAPPPAASASCDSQYGHPVMQRGQTFHSSSGSNSAYHTAYNSPAPNMMPPPYPAPPYGGESYYYPDPQMSRGYPQPPPYNYNPQAPPPMYNPPDAPGYGYARQHTAAADFGGPPSYSGDPIASRLQRCVQENRLQNFYPDRTLQRLVQDLKRLEPKVQNLARKWNLTHEIMLDMYQLALYDIILLCDDSGSMAFQEGGERIKDLKVAVGYVAEAASLFDLDGIEVRFLNSNVEGSNIKDCKGADDVVSKVRFSGLTPLGTALEKKILTPFLFNKLRSNSLRKPVMCVVITDGSPAGEPANALFDALARASKLRHQHGGIVSFGFAQVGLDQEAQKFLSELDRHPQVGDILDVTSSYELEEAEMATKGARLTPEMWIAKLLLGPIDKTYDDLDE